MPVTATAKRALKKSLENRIRNKPILSRLRNLLKEAVKAVRSKSNNAREKIVAFESYGAKVSKKTNIVPRTRVQRLVSRLTLALKKNES
jgi:ribosomal protein S20